VLFSSFSILLFFSPTDGELFAVIFSSAAVGHHAIAHLEQDPRPLPQIEENKSPPF